MSSYYGVNHILLRNSVRCLFSNQRNGWPMGGRGARRTRRNLRQMACKPGSVHRPRGQLDGHSSGTFVAERLARPTRTAARKCASPAVKPARRPYLVLLPVGFAMPLPLPVARCALTAPFHPYPLPRRGNGRFAFCGTFPRVAPAGRYPAPYFRGARTFLPPRNLGERPSGHLAQLQARQLRRPVQARRCKKFRPRRKVKNLDEYLLHTAVMTITACEFTSICQTAAPDEVFRFRMQ